MTSLRSYALVTGAYWGFTITDGALRMLVVLHFYKLGYNAVSIAFLFLFYEFFGIITNLFGGWIASRSGAKVTLFGGLTLQIFSLLMLAGLNARWSAVASVFYVMVAQALSGIAKDLTKMSSKSAIKVVVPEGKEGALFRWVARLTGSKNALKGLGFFIGGALLGTFGFVGALTSMAAALFVVLLATAATLSGNLGRSKKKVKFTSLLSKSPAINSLSSARLFLFASRDAWFVVGLPVFLSQLGWTSYSVGAFLALWVIGYGIVQAAVPEILRVLGNRSVDGSTATGWAFGLAVIPAGLALTLHFGMNRNLVLMSGLAVFAIIFAINSAIHSYLVLAYTDQDSVALNVGFYYMANAGGRLLGTLASGVVFQIAGFTACLWCSTAMVIAAAFLSLPLTKGRAVLWSRQAPWNANNGILEVSERLRRIALIDTTSHSITTSALQVAYEQTGPDSGEPILLLHGFPYDVRQYDGVRDRIAGSDRRVIVPYLRGFGPTRYRSEQSFRSGQQAALGKDIVDLLDALGIERATLAGYDWGGRGACVAAALWPDRVRALVTMGGYTVQNIARSAVTPESAEQERQFWYQWYFQTERGRQGLEKNRDELCRLLWSAWSPAWKFSEDEFITTTESFRNPDFVATVTQSYRHRYGNTAGDPDLEALEAQLEKQPPIACPTIVLHGDDDRVNPPWCSEGHRRHFTGPYERRILHNVGHCPPAEAPNEIARAIEDILH